MQTKSLELMVPMIFFTFLSACGGNGSPSTGPNPVPNARTSNTQPSKDNVLNLESARNALQDMFQKTNDERVLSELAKTPVERGSTIVLGSFEIDLTGRYWRLTIATPASRLISEGTFQRANNGTWEATQTSEREQHLPMGR